MVLLYLLTRTPRNHNFQTLASSRKCHRSVIKQNENKIVRKVDMICYLIQLGKYNKESIFFFIIILIWVSSFIFVAVAQRSTMTVVTEL